MKQNEKRIIISVAITLIIAIGCFVNFKNMAKEKTAVLEFTVYDAENDSTTVHNTLTIKEKDVVNLDIELDSITNNDITILEINSKNIKISREITKYKVISETERKAEPYKETVVQIVEYGKNIEVEADEREPFGPEYSAPRYHRYVKVMKEKK